MRELEWRASETKIDVPNLDGLEWVGCRNSTASCDAASDKCSVCYKRLATLSKCQDMREKKAANERLRRRGTYPSVVDIASEKCADYQFGMRFSTVKGAERKAGAKYTKERYKKMRCKTGMSTPKAASASLFPEPQNTRAPRPGVPKIFVGWCKVRRGAFEARLRRGSRKACPASSWACSMQPGYFLKLGMVKICQREKTIVTGEDDRFICDADGGCCNGSIDCRIFCADVGRRPLHGWRWDNKKRSIRQPRKKNPHSMLARN